MQDDDDHGSGFAEAVIAIIATIRRGAVALPVKLAVPAEDVTAVLTAAGAPAGGGVKVEGAPRGCSSAGGPNW